MRICSVPGCGRRHNANGLCGMHERRLKVRGTLEPRPVTGRYRVSYDSKSDTREWEHRRIAAKALGRPLPKGVEVHHHDNNGRNNGNGNLVICQDHDYHFLLHKRQRILQRGGNPNTDSWCSVCKTVQPIENFYTRKSGSRKGRLTTMCVGCCNRRYDRNTADL